MDVFSTELGIWLSFDKTSEFSGGGFEPHPFGTPLVLKIHSLGVTCEPHCCLVLSALFT
jgi:hypothetical protein